LAYLGTAGEEDEVERQLQELRVFLAMAEDHRDRAGIEILRDERDQKLCRCGKLFAELEEAGVTRSQRRQRRTNEEEQRSVEWAYDERYAIGLAIDEGLVTGRCKKARDRRLHRLHPGP